MGVFIALGAVFIIRLFMLQVVDRSYKELADNNALRYVTQYPARGKIFDRNGQLLVFNEAVYDLMVIPRQATRRDTLHPFDTTEFCRLLKITKESYVERMKKAKKESYVKPTPFITQISKEDYAHVAEVLYRYPGFFFQTRTVRHYPNAIAAHTLGDIGEISAPELEKDKEGECYYRQGDYIGKSGLERSYEKELRGVKGLKVVVVVAMRVLCRTGLTALRDVFHFIASGRACRTAKYRTQTLFHHPDMLRINARIDAGSHHLGDSRRVAKALNEVGRIVIALVGNHRRNVGQLQRSHQHLALTDTQRSDSH